MKTLFSVIVCTYDRPGHLERCLGSIFRQSYPRDYFEVILVDNGGMDETARAAAELERLSPVPFTFRRELRTGLSHARNAGIRIARHDFIAYLDDDAAAGEGWLASFDDTIRSMGADVVGGKVVPVPEKGFTPPAWFETQYVKGFFGLDWETMGYGGGVLEIRFPLYVGGGNSCTRRALFDLEWARYDGRLGRSGSRHFQGEETLLNFFLERAGYKIYYNPAAVIYHFFGPDRVNKRHMLMKAFWGGYSDAWMHRQMFGPRRVISDAPRKLGASLRSFLGARGKGDSASLFEKKCLLAHDIGYVLRLARVWELM